MEKLSPLQSEPVAVEPVAVETKVSYILVFQNSQKSFCSSTCQAFFMSLNHVDFFVLS